MDERREGVEGKRDEGTVRRERKVEERRIEGEGVEGGEEEWREEVKEE